MLVTKRFTFDAAHQLPNHDGKCAQPHGHTYVVEVTVSGERRPADGGPDAGMLVDFAKLTRVWKVHLEPHLDHQDLNSSLAGVVHPTTAEALAEWMLHQFRNHLPRYLTGPNRHVDVASVRVWETPTSSAVAT